MEFNKSKPIYMQIVDYVFEKILLGEWAEEERIPSVRDIAVTLETTPNTTMRAYDYLQEQGVIYNKRGVGFFLSPDARDRVVELQYKEFCEKEAPAFFRKMQLLNINLEKLAKLHIDFTSKQFLVSLLLASLFLSL